MKIKNIIFLAIFLFTGCTTKQIDINKITNKEDFELKYTKNINYNIKNNKIEFINFLEKRPTTGNFKLLYFQDKLLKMSFDIKVIDKNKMELKKPLKTIGEYTGGGFKLGIESLGHTNTNDPIVLTIPIITTIGGFIVGVIASTPDIIRELKDSIIVNNTEVLNYYKTYLYDENNKLINVDINYTIKSAKKDFE